MFVTAVFASESHKVLRYTDEGETTEVCKWTVDLSSLPTFKQNSTMHKSGGFYTGGVSSYSSSKFCHCFILEFELGLELDNVEVRGVLMYKERPWERRVSTYVVLHVSTYMRGLALRWISFDWPV